MNVLECYITDIIYEKTYPTPKWDKANRKWVEFKLE